jgi:hypothetical protein
MIHLQKFQNIRDIILGTLKITILLIFLTCPFWIGFVAPQIAPPKTTEKSLTSYGMAKAAMERCRILCIRTMASSIYRINLQHCKIACADDFLKNPDEFVPAYIR